MRVANGPEQPALRDEWPPALRALLPRCWATAPEARPAVEELRDQLTLLLVEIRFGEVLQPLAERSASGAPPGGSAVGSAAAAWRKHSMDALGTQGGWRAGMEGGDRIELD